MVIADELSSLPRTSNIFSAQEDGAEQPFELAMFLGH
jgi:hypothetical protein